MGGYVEIDDRKRWRGRLFHDFRRTVVNLVRTSVPERVAMTLTGHKTQAVFERYNIVSDGDLELAARNLDRFAAGTISGTVGGSGQNGEPTSPLKSTTRP